MGSTFSASGLTGKHITAVTDIDNGSGPLTSRDVIAGHRRRWGVGAASTAVQIFRK